MFIVVWLLGDIFNILGAVLQGVLPTMIILAVYYTLADIVLLLQLWYYRGFTLKDDVKKPADTDNERQPLLSAPAPGTSDHRRGSFGDDLRRQGHHFSPATPLHDAYRDPPAITNSKPTTTMQKVLFNSAAILIVCVAGIFGWYLSTHNSLKHHHHHHYNRHDSGPSEPLEFDFLGQVFGYLCTVFYLASRGPQIWLNYQRKSTEGVSLLFFLFACIGNLTYDMSIFAYSPEKNCRHGPGRCAPGEASAIYSRYIAVNASWIAGSLGTLILDGLIFVQFFLYKKDDDDSKPASVNGNGHVVPERAISD